MAHSTTTDEDQDHTASSGKANSSTTVHPNDDIDQPSVIGTATFDHPHGNIVPPTGTTPVHEGDAKKDATGVEDKLPLSRRFHIEIKRWEHYKQFLGELLASAILMFFVGGVSMSRDPHVTLMTHAGAAALGIMVIIFMFGTISGAHVNPAVSFGFACVNKMPWMKVPIYILGQVIGAVVGTLVASAMFDASPTVLLAIPYQGVPKSLVIEIMSAFMFMFLACAVATNAQVTGLFASVAVAVSIAINIIVAGPISGASMNPARALGPALVTGYFKNLWLYLIAPMVGAGIGARSHYVLNL